MPSATCNDFIQPSYNIMMVDTSGSMGHYGQSLMEQWNKYVAPILEKEGNYTVRYVFSDLTVLVGESPRLEKDDFLNRSTNLVEALEKISKEVEECKFRHIKVFFITDGDDNMNAKDLPESIIKEMKCPDGKTCEVFVLGIGRSYPVSLSLALRKNLHCGNVNIPNLFQVNKREEMEEKMIEICKNCISVEVNLSVEGSLLPGGPLKSTFHLGDFVYLFDYVDGQNIILTYNTMNYNLLDLKIQNLNIDILNLIISQWHKIIIQIQNMDNQNFLLKILELENQIYQEVMNGMKDEEKSFTLGARLGRLKLKNDDGFHSKLNNIKKIILQGLFIGEQELANAVLSSIATNSKYAIKAMQLKGHTDKDFKEDIDNFVKIFKENRSQIMSLKIVPENCCRVTLTSTITDLQDHNFLTLLYSVDKYQLINTWTMTGIPVLTGLLNATLLNPWSYTIKNIVGEPYAILGVVALELFAQKWTEFGEKDILITPGKEETRFNAIIPIFTPEEAQIMAPLMKTRLFTKMTTTAVWKNPTILDFNAHLGALAVLLLKLFEKHPIGSRPEFVHQIINNIKATVSWGYIDRSKLKIYWKVLKSVDNVNQALMTESNLLFEGMALKCETLIKPMFIMYMKIGNDHHHPQHLETIKRIMKMITLEYVGRCISKIDNDKIKYPYSHFFMDSNKYEEAKERALKYIEEIFDKLAPKYNLKNYYTLGEVKQAIKKEDLLLQEWINDNLFSEIHINVERVRQLYSLSHAGDMSWTTLEVFIREIMMGYEESEINSVMDELFNPSSMWKYLFHAFTYDSSRLRLENINKITDYCQSIPIVRNKIIFESIIEWDLNSILNTKLEQNWVASYINTHEKMVYPMTAQEIMNEAKKYQWFNSDSSFTHIYKYNEDTQMLRNACQIFTCPHFLRPP
ncbi:hypothetical protein TCON_1629 [Astathelohania contejeani]|uniref:VWFA domain-containing protein n=1 Tax=Astathelohania contejeani TaxID=164912 RepID=A0ABQ7HY89_9MICR|nr:hypothetical protein TCON_1629 [Thelohania contejeani]